MIPFVLKDFTPFEENRNKGLLLENFFYSEILKKWSGEIYFWRTKEKAEVDFVLRDFYGNIIPIEVKAIEMSKPTITRSLQTFLKTYQVKKGYVVNLLLKETVKIDGTQIVFILPYEIQSISVV